MSALWDEVKDSLHRPGTFLSGGQLAAALHRSGLAVAPKCS
jgi:ABC-type phosphate transport system ATPase subunit